MQQKQILILAALGVAAYFLLNRTANAGIVQGTGTLPAAGSGLWATRTGQRVTGPAVDPWTGLAVDVASDLYGGVSNWVSGWGSNGSGSAGGSGALDYSSDPLQYE